MILVLRKQGAFLTLANSSHLEKHGKTTQNLSVKILVFDGLKMHSELSLCFDY